MPVRFKLQLVLMAQSGGDGEALIVPSAVGRTGPRDGAVLGMAAATGRGA
jgi:hypothetical protein